MLRLIYGFGRRQRIRARPAGRPGVPLEGRAPVAQSPAVTATLRPPTRQRPSRFRSRRRRTRGVAGAEVAVAVVEADTTSMAPRPMAKPVARPPRGSGSVCKRPVLAGGVGARMQREQEDSALLRASRSQFNKSGRQDLNLRPPGPQPGALPDCATPRDTAFTGQAGDGNRTRPGTLEGSSATTTPRPQERAPS
jgi:hypothetical protein